jgi:hypothetical protein
VVDADGNSGVIFFTPDPHRQLSRRGSSIDVCNLSRLLLLALLVLAPLVGLAILVPLAFDALVSTADVFVAAVSVALAFNAFAALADVIATTVFVFAAFLGQCAVGQSGKSYQTERATSGGLEHATATGLRSQDAGDGIKPISFHDLLLYARCLRCFMT